MLDYVKNLLYPPRCVWCGEFIEKGSECRKCKQELPLRTGKMKTREFYSAAAAPFRYEGRVRESILRHKFRRKRSYAAVYARYLSDTIKEELQGEYDLISFVPVSFLREHTRGFDQAKLIAEKTAALLGADFARTLRRTRDTERQSRLQDISQKRANVSDAFRCVYNVKGKRVLIIDDILTTGATMSECARTLLMAGAKDVIAASVAYAGKK